MSDASHSSPSSPPSHTSGQGAQDQAVLPFRIALGICLRGLKARIGRAGVTLLGVSCGIAFLMSVVAGFHMKERMRGDIERQREVERRVKGMTSELGVLKDKRLLVVAGGGLSATDRDLLDRLAKPGGSDSRRIGKVEGVALPEADPARDGAEAVAVVGLGDWPTTLPAAWDAALADKTFFTFAALSPTAQERLQTARARPLPLTLDLRAEEKAEIDRRLREQRNRTGLIVFVSLLITVIGIANALLMSVTERFREIGTMKCLGALSGFVVRLFLIESSLIGFVGSVLGTLLGLLFPFFTYAWQYGFGNFFGAVFGSGSSLLALLGYSAACMVSGVILAVVAGIYPARVAAKMIPAVALSSNV